MSWQFCETQKQAFKTTVKKVILEVERLAWATRGITGKPLIFIKGRGHLFIPVPQ